MTEGAAAMIERRGRGEGGSRVPGISDDVSGARPVRM